MTPFQYISLPILALLFTRELVRGRRGAESYGPWLLRVGIWLSAAIAIADPDLVQFVAVKLGIGLGVNLVVYLFVLTSIGTSFYFYSRGVRMQRQITQLIRHLAIQEAKHGPDRSPASES